MLCCVCLGECIIYYSESGQKNPFWDFSSNLLKILKIRRNFKNKFVFSTQKYKGFSNMYLTTLNIIWERIIGLIIILLPSFFQVNLLGHPQYSPGLAPNNFSFFPHIKKKLRGQRVSSPADTVGVCFGGDSIGVKNTHKWWSYVKTFWVSLC